jgi:hypothetical protein
MENLTGNFKEKNFVRIISHTSVDGFNRVADEDIRGG